MSESKKYRVHVKTVPVEWKKDFDGIVELTTDKTRMSPEILQHFNSALLSTPATFGDNLKVLWQVYEYIHENISYKALKSNYDPWKEKIESLEKQFLELYERQKVKEEKLKEEAKYKDDFPFYYIRLPHKGDEKLFSRLRWKRLSN